jgi:hypothetical protein
MTVTLRLDEVFRSLLQKDWGVRQSSNYGACMTRHGEIE